MPARDASSLQFDVAKSYEEMSRRAEEYIIAELKRRPSLILCASAGGTPRGLYELLAERGQGQPRLFSKMRVLQIDEWGGLPRNHPASCESDLQSKLLQPLGIGKQRYTGFRTEAKNPAAECAKIARWLASNGPIDICILGLGVNGHVAMNEPGAFLKPHTHIAELTESSLNHPMLRDLERKPSHGLTLGMSDILASKLVLLLVNGPHKADALKQLRGQAVTTQFPASFLWLHPRARVLCDGQAWNGP
jgi:galactosamine-6-phosphate isomerase